MKKVLCTLLVLVLTSTVCASTSMASIVGIYTGTFVNVNGGSDSLGLDGAEFFFGVAFDCDARYIDRFGFPVIDTFDHILSIGGSGSADGSHFEADQIGLYATFDGQYFGGGPGNGFAEFSIGSTTLFLIRLTETVSVSVGDLIDVSHLGTTLFTGAGFNWQEGDTTYGVRDFEASTFDDCDGRIPEPGTIAIWSVLGLAGVMVRRRKVA